MEKSLKIHENYRKIGKKEVRIRAGKKRGKKSRYPFFETFPADSETFSLGGGLGFYKCEKRQKKGHRTGR
jgi:hypothetical protein